MTQKICRVHVANFGLSSVYYAAETLDLRNPRTGEPDHVLVSMPNGTGKTSLESAISWIFSPSVKRFISTLQKPDYQPHEYLHDRPTYVIAETKSQSGLRRYFGYVAILNPRYEGNGAIDRWFFTLPSSRLRFEHLPAPGLKFRPSENTGARWREELGDLRQVHGSDFEVTQNQSEWLEILGRHGMDWELFDLQAEFARNEGGIDKLLTFRGERDAIEKILDLTLSPDRKEAIEDDARETLDSMRELPAERRRVEALEEMEETVSLFSELAATHRAADEKVRGARHEVRGLARAMLDRVEAAERSLGRIDAEIASEASIKALREGDVARLSDRLGRLQATESQILLDASVEAEAEAEAENVRAEKSLRAIRAAADAAEIEEAERRIEPLREQLANADIDLAPLRAEVAKLGRGARLRLTEWREVRRERRDELAAAIRAAEKRALKEGKDLAEAEKGLKAARRVEEGAIEARSNAMARLEGGLRSVGLETSPEREGPAAVEAALRGAEADAKTKVKSATSTLKGARRSEEEAMEALRDAEERSARAVAALDEASRASSKARDFVSLIEGQIERLDRSPEWSGLVDVLPETLAERRHFLEEEASRHAADARGLTIDIEQVSVDAGSIREHGVAGVDREITACLSRLREHGVEGVSAFASWASVALGPERMKAAIERCPSLSRGIVLEAGGVAIGAVEAFVRGFGASVPVVLVEAGGAEAASVANAHDLRVVVPDKEEAWSRAAAGRRLDTLSDKMADLAERQESHQRSAKSIGHLVGGYKAIEDQIGEDGLDRARDGAREAAVAERRARQEVMERGAEVEDARRAAEGAEGAAGAASRALDEARTRVADLRAMPPLVASLAEAVRDRDARRDETRRLEDLVDAHRDAMSVARSEGELDERLLLEVKADIRRADEGLARIARDDGGTDATDAPSDPFRALGEYEAQDGALTARERDSNDVIAARIEEMVRAASTLRMKFRGNYPAEMEASWKPLMSCLDFESEKRARREVLDRRSKALEAARIDVGVARSHREAHEPDPIDELIDGGLDGVLREIEESRVRVDALRDVVAGHDAALAEKRRGREEAASAMEIGRELLETRADDIGSIEGVIAAEVDDGAKALKARIALRLGDLRGAEKRLGDARGALSDVWGMILRKIGERVEVFADVQALVVGIERPEDFAPHADRACSKLRMAIDLTSASIAAKEPARENFRNQLDDLLGIAIDRFDDLIDESRKASADGQSFFRIEGIVSRSRKGVDKFVSPDDRKLAVGMVMDHLLGIERGDVPHSARIAAMLVSEAMRQASIREGRGRSTSPELFVVGLQFRKPGTVRPEWDPIQRAGTSGGEGVTIAIILYLILTRIRREGDVGVLMLENPIGKSSRADFVASWFKLANSVGAQLVVFSALKDQGAVDAFETVVRGTRRADERRTYVSFGRVHAPREVAA